MTLDKILNFSAVKHFSAPFQYFISPEAFTADVSQIILEWLETDGPWRLVETDFYEQFEFSFWDVQLPPHLSFLQDQNLLDDLKTKVASLFRVEFSERVDFTAHKLIPGQRIRIHNDFILGRETHRLLIQLNRNWRDEHGGLLLFFNSSDPADIHKIFRPFHNSLVGFAISPASHHAVSTIHGGERFTLVYSFYGN
jgi:Rps23 Pro-64 3,4-dihydroxylase Tpa1-like proline 4-hydroxylase